MGLMAAGLGGCVGPFGGPRPGFEVTAADLVERTDEGVKLEFTLTGANRDEEPLPLRHVDYTLQIEGDTVFSGRRAAERTLPAGDRQQIVLPATVPLEALAGLSSPRYVLSGQIEYSKPGALADTLFDAKLVRPKVSFSDRGSLALDGITGVAASPVQVPTTNSATNSTGSSQAAPTGAATPPPPRSSEIGTMTPR